MDFHHQSIIVTGASDGLGKALANRLVSLGATVIGIGKTQSKLDQVRSQLGERFYPFQADLSKPGELDHVYNQIINQFPVIDILVNNAGVGFGGSTTDHDLAVLERLIMTNVFGVMGSVYKVFPGMKARKHGQILNINSIFGLETNQDRSPYCGTKHGITGYTKALSLEAKQYGIKVMQLHPGGMDTNIFEAFQPGYGMQAWMMDKERVVDLIITMLSQPDDMIVDSMVVRKFGVE